MKPRFGVYWFNPYFGMNKWCLKICHTMQEVWAFVDRHEKNLEELGYERFSFKLLNLQMKKGEEC